ncbi:MAG TPA: hypothetical protein VLA25_00930, partial [Methylotenera sp.]|nr:hypothetical protein [Methylotenera sp.]
MNSNNVKYKVVAGIVVLLTLLFVPSPLLPPHRIAEAIQSLVGISWKTAYLVAAVGLQTIFFCSIGILSALAVKRAATLRGRLLQIIAVPIIVVLVALIIRSVKMGHFPIWINTAIPIVACLSGVWLGLGLLYKRGKIILFVLVAVIGATFWLLSGGASAALNRTTENHLQKLVAESSAIPSGEARFGKLMKVAFINPFEASGKMSAVQHNRAAILALGIALGDQRLAKYVGLNRDSKLVQQAALLLEGTTLRERGDWPRHFCVSAALAVLENPLVSDAGGLIKEQLDALTKGSGFSFCDFAADRAGIRFANAATNSEADAIAMQDL